MLASILAVTIFLAMFVLIVLDKIEHYLITLGCGLLTIIFVLGICLHSGQAIMEVLNVKSIFTTSFWHTVGQASEDSSGISWATIIFIAGMMHFPVQIYPVSHHIPGKHRLPSYWYILHHN